MTEGAPPHEVAPVQVLKAQHDASSIKFGALLGHALPPMLHATAHILPCRTQANQKNWCSL